MHCSRFYFSCCWQHHFLFRSLLYCFNCCYFHLYFACLHVWRWYCFVIKFVSFVVIYFIWFLFWLCCCSFVLFILPINFCSSCYSYFSFIMLLFFFWIYCCWWRCWLFLPCHRCTFLLLTMLIFVFVSVWAARHSLSFSRKL